MYMLRRIGVPSNRAARGDDLKCRPFWGKISVSESAAPLWKCRTGLFAPSGSLGTPTAQAMNSMQHNAEDVSGIQRICRVHRVGNHTVTHACNFKWKASSVPQKGFYTNERAH